MEDFELELKHDFLSESDDLLGDAENAFMSLEPGPGNADLLNEIFRLAHNLKGTSQAVGFEQLSEVTHVAENLILKLKEGVLEVTEDIISTLLEFKDKITEMIEGLKGDLDAKFDISAVIEKLEGVISNQGESSAGGSAEPEKESADVQEEEVDEGKLALEVDAGSDAFSDDLDLSEEEITTPADIPAINEAALDSLRELGMDLDQTPEETPTESPEISAAALESLQELGMDLPANPDLSSVEKTEKVSEVPRNDTEKKEPVPKVQASEKKGSSDNGGSPKSAQRGQSDESIRVKLSRIDEINNVVGELVILQTGLYQRRFEHIQDDLSNKSIGMMGKLFKEVQELAMSLRMLPLKSTFQKMSRIVRDTSKALGKEVTLHIVGEETEVDKTVLEKLADPLVHIVRNSIDHGLEGNDDREQIGKERKGNVELMAFHEGSNLVVQVTDDGKGIDPEVIKRKAIEKGVLDEYSKISDQEVIQFIFHPGFSTKEQVTEVSGRGVGMDVVKTNIELLGGEVKLMSKLGEGTSLKIVLPLTLAIIEGIVIKAASEQFVIPLGQVYEILQVTDENIEKFPGMASLFKLRGEVVPLFHLNKKVGLGIEKTGRNTVIVVRGLSHTFGVIVDDIVVQQQIVIKKLGEDIQNQGGMMGSSIMADGKPSLILDLFELFKDDLKQSRGHKNYLKNKEMVA